MQMNGPKRHKHSANKEPQKTNGWERRTHSYAPEIQKVSENLFHLAWVHHGHQSGHTLGPPWPSKCSYFGSTMAIKVLILWVHHGHQSAHTLGPPWPSQWSYFGSTMAIKVLILWVYHGHHSGHTLGPPWPSKWSYLTKHNVWVLQLCQQTLTLSQIPPTHTWRMDRQRHTERLTEKSDSTIVYMASSTTQSLNHDSLNCSLAQLLSLWNMPPWDIHMHNYSISKLWPLQIFMCTTILNHDSLGCSLAQIPSLWTMAPWYIHLHNYFVSKPWLHELFICTTTLSLNHAQLFSL